MTKRTGTVLIGNSVVIAAAAILAFAAPVKAQTSFSEISIRAAHGLYEEGRMPRAQSFGLPGAFASVADSGPGVKAYSSSSEEGVASADPISGELLGGGEVGFSGVARSTQTVTTGLQPFRSFAIATKVGSAGIGFDVATPLAQRLNLRVGASFFSYNTALTEDGLNITGAIKFQNASASVDIYPFNGSFRISPGFTFKNDNSLNATLFVPGGQSFSLGDDDYTSDSADPIHGTAGFTFGKNLAPRLTMGFGNMLPRRGGRFSFPVEVGFQYIAHPTVSLVVTGSSCGSQKQGDGTVQSGCGPVDQTDVQQEQNELRNDLSPLRFYPIASIGISYRLGRARSY